MSWTQPGAAIAGAAPAITNAARIAITVVRASVGRRGTGGGYASRPPSRGSPTRIVPPQRCPTQAPASRAFVVVIFGRSRRVVDSAPPGRVWTDLLRTRRRASEYAL